MHFEFTDLAKVCGFLFRPVTAFSTSRLSLATLLLVGGIAMNAHGDVVSAIVSGPGGSGLTPTLGGNLAEPYLIYTSNLPLDVAVTVDAGGTYYISETAVFDIKNTTGTAWSGFTWQLISNPSGSLVYNPASNSGVEFIGNLPVVTGSATLASFSGGTVPDQGFMAPAFDIVYPSAGTFIIRETPIPVPEPSSIVTALIGIAGFFAWGHRRRKH